MPCTDLLEGESQAEVLSLAAIHVELLTLIANAPPLVAQQHFFGLLLLFFSLLSFFVLRINPNLYMPIKDTENNAK